MPKFELGNTLAEALKHVPDSGTIPAGREQIEYIDLTAIDSDEDNFYSLDGIGELAANIELVGLQQPMRVRRNPDFPERYILVSGHRRRAAMQLLNEEGQERFAKVPCIVEEPAGSEALQELRLIYANSDTRKMSSADLSRQAERVEALLYRLKEEGFDFPGRMRDHVAEACRVSKTKLANLKVIREGLIPEIREMWERGELNEAKALALARCKKGLQGNVYDRFGPELLSYWSEKQLATRVTEVLPAPKADAAANVSESGTTEPEYLTPETLEDFPPRMIELRWRDGNAVPDEDFDAVCEFDCGGTVLTTLATHFNGHWDFYVRGSIGARIDAECLRWFPLPVE